MTTYPGQPAPVNRTLTWIAIACFAIGAVLTGFFVYRIIATAPRTPQPIENGVVHLTREGLTIYASVPVLTPPCEAKDADGDDVTLRKPTGSENITINGDTWYVVARSVDSVPAGDYSISCTDDESSATYAAGPRSSVVAFVLAILGTVFSFLVFLGLGILLLVIDVVRRRRRPTGTFAPQSGAPGNYYPYSGGYQPGTGPPPGRTFPEAPPYNPGPNPDRPQGR